MSDKDQKREGPTAVRGTVNSFKRKKVGPQHCVCGIKSPARRESAVRQPVLWGTFPLQLGAGTSRFCCCSVPQACPAFWDHMDCSLPGFPVLHYLPEFAQTHVHWCCHPTASSSVSPFSSHPQSFPASGSFPMSRLFASGGQRIGVSVSTSVLPTTIQG